MIVVGSVIPSRAAHSPQRGAKSSIASIAAKAARVVGRRQVALVPLGGRGRLAPLAAGEDADLHVPPAPGRVDLGGVDLELDVPGGVGEGRGDGGRIGPERGDRRRLRLARPADPLVADLPAAALGQEALGDGEGMPAPEQADQPRGLSREEPVQAEEAVDEVAPDADTPGRRNRPARGRPPPARSSPSWSRSPCVVPSPRRSRFGRRPLFFEGFGPRLEGGLQRPPQEIAAVAQQERLATVDDLSLRGGLGGRLQLLGQDEGLLDDQSLDRREAVEIRREHGCIILECDPSV